MDNEKISVLVVEPEKKPYAKEISSGLSSLQHEVGGYIQAVYPYEEPVAIICDEEAKLKGSELNRVLRDEDGHIYDVVAGTFEERYLSLLIFNYTLHNISRFFCDIIVKTIMGVLEWRTRMTI